jgi:hypothetical protein
MTQVSSAYAVAHLFSPSPSLTPKLPPQLMLSYFDDNNKVAKGASILNGGADPNETVCFDLEFVSLALPNPPELCLIQVAKASLHGKVFLFDAITASNVLTAGPPGGSLRDLLSNSTITKVFHDVRMDSKALAGRHVR